MKEDMIISRVSQARALLSQARDARGAKVVVDMAHAAAVYGKRQKLSQESIEFATAVKVDAMALMGEFLAVSEKNKGAKGLLGGGTRGTKKEPRVNAPVTLAESGITKKESSVCQKLAVMSREEPGKFAAIRGSELPVSAFTWHRMSGTWQTGIDRRHWLDYVKVGLTTPFPIWILFLHGNGRAKDTPENLVPPCGLFGETVGKLKDRIHHQHESHGPSGMVYWAAGSLRKIAEIEEIPCT